MCCPNKEFSVSSESPIKTEKRAKRTTGMKRPRKHGDIFDVIVPRPQPLQANIDKVDIKLDVQKKPFATEIYNTQRCKNK